MRNNLIVALDGYSSCGKSTLAKAIAKKLGYIYIDSGAMYRAVALYFLRNQVNVENDQAVSEALSNIKLDFHSRDYQTHILLNGEEVSDEIRQMHVSAHVSTVAANKQVRVEMVRQQQQMGQVHNIVMDGRDIGTAVFKDAQVKLFMTADPLIRATRRHKEIVANGEQVSLQEILASLEQRDFADTTRKESPLVMAEDAILLDNSELNQEEQLECVLNIIKEKQQGITLGSLL